MHPRAIKNGNVSTLKRLTGLCYPELKTQYEVTVPAYYRLCAISKAAGILWHHTKSRSREDFHQKQRLPTCQSLVSLAATGSALLQVGGSDSLLEMESSPIFCSTNTLSRKRKEKDCRLYHSRSLQIHFRFLYESSLQSIHRNPSSE